MAQLSNTFEGGTDSVTITTGNSGGTSGDAWTVNLDSSTAAYDGTRHAHGGISGRLATGATSASPYLTWTSGVSGATLYARAYVYMTANPAGNLNFLRLLAGTTTVGTVRVNSSGKVGLLYSTGTLGGTSSASIPLNQWFRVEVRLTASTTAGSMDVRCYLGADPDSATATETLSVSGVSTGTNSSLTALRIGLVAAMSNASINVDDVALSDAGWIGPATATTHPVTNAAETGTAQAAGRSKTQPTGTASGTDTAQAPDRTKTGAVVNAAETSTAQPVACGKTNALSVASGPDAAQSAGRAKTGPAGTSAAVDAAQPAGSGKTQALGASGGTEAAQTMGRSKSILAAPATDAATAGPLSVQHLLGTAEETGAAQSLADAKSKPLGNAATTGTAQDAGRTKTDTLPPAGQADGAQAITPAQSMVLGAAAESGQAQPFTAPGILLAVQEDEAGQTLTAVKTMAPGAATDTGQTLSLGGRKTLTLGAAGCINEGRPPGRRKTLALTPAAETGEAVSITRAPTLALGIALATDLTQPFGHIKALGASRAGSVCEARALGRRKGLTLTAAGETCGALVLAGGAEPPGDTNATVGAPVTGWAATVSAGRWRVSAPWI